MNRTDRLYALVEELRAYAPRPRTSRELADRFEVDPQGLVYALVNDPSGNLIGLFSPPAE